MSNYIAVRGVTETLKTLLTGEMENKVTVSFGPPDLKPEKNSSGKGRINLYLYKIEENAYLRNQEIPGQDYPRTTNPPPLSLVLHYLLTAFPDSDEYNENYDLDTHKILGDAMRVFHDYPILKDSIELPSGSGRKLLHTSLQDQFEKIKITLEPLDTEELTKIWMGLNNPYRLSMGYSISVVQIESKKPKKLPLPIKARELHVTQRRRPHIANLLVIPSGKIPEIPLATARIGDKLMIRGSNIAGISTELIIGYAEFSVTPKSDKLIEFTIPRSRKLQPGPTFVGVRSKTTTEIIKGGMSGQEKIEQGEQVIDSNKVALMLVPKITSIEPLTGAYTEVLTIKGNMLYRKGLKSLVMVGDVVIEVEKKMATDTSLATSLRSLRRIEQGVYPVRVRVNGCESLEEDKTFTLTKRKRISRGKKR